MDLGLTSSPMPKAVMLFETTDRDRAHQFLEEVLAEKTHPRAECREDPNVAKPYQVWNGPANWNDDA